jgi:REP element-mobilizing transposase RayT
MPRKPLIKTNTFPYHIYNRLLDKKFYPEKLMPRVWEIYCDAARVLTWAFGVRIQMMVLMSSHYHLLLHTPDENIAESMLYFQREISRRLTALVGSQDFRFGARYKWKLVENPVQFENTYRYIASNPVEAGLSLTPALYPFSSLAGIYGNEVHRCPIYPCCHFSTLLPDKLEDLETWIEVRG